MRNSKRKNNIKEKTLRKFLPILLCSALVTGFAMTGCSDKQNVEEAAAVQEEVVKKPVREYKFPKAEEENDLLKIATDIGDEEAKNVYLTFDDGPTQEVTPKVLDVLKEHDVEATFFVLGKMLEKNRDVAERVVDEGHLLANHSYNHTYGSLYASEESFMDEINKTQALIDEISEGDSFKLIRFPGGGHNAGSYGSAKQKYKESLKKEGYYFVDWNCLNGDAEAALRSAEQLVSRTKETAIGKNLVILMHDAAAKTTTPEALGEIIEYFEDNGYDFKRLDEIDYYTGRDAEDDAEESEDAETDTEESEKDTPKSSSSEMIL